MSQARFGGAAARSSVPVSSGGSYRRALGQVARAVAPTQLGRVGSGYGERTSSRTGRVTFHAGWDFVAPRGTPIYAADAGEVVVVAREQPGGPYRGYGNAVVIFHPEDQTYVLYAHLQRADVRVGEPVAMGQQIGTAGNTTNGKFPRMPPHLHLEVRQPKPDGSRPFPGPYGRYNLDPKEWFERRGMVIGNRWQRPPGTLVPGDASVSSLSELGMEWWETVFTDRPPPGTVYEPEQATANALWDWSRLIAGVVVFSGTYWLIEGELPVVGRRR